MFSRHTVNHRLKAREHLAEGCALATEGACAPAADRLFRAAAHAIEEIVTTRAAVPEDRMQLVGSLAHDGALPLDACARLDDLWRSRGDADACDDAVEAAFATVQALVDVAAGLPAGPASSFDDAPEAAPGRATPWLAAARDARRRRLTRHAAVIVASLLVLAGVALASVSDGTPPTAEKTEFGVYAAGS